tara:strand:- start:298 stop:609 length:312 start_codon:yes stop_codon:yes gene_type:complete
MGVPATKGSGKRRNCLGFAVKRITMVTASFAMTAPSLRRNGGEKRRKLMRDRTMFLVLCLLGFFSIFYSLEYYLIGYTNLVALGLYSFGILTFVFGVRGIVRN